MRIPVVVTLEYIAQPNVTRMRADGAWIAARPEPYYSALSRWRAAWLVLTGRADAVIGWENVS